MLINFKNWRNLKENVSPATNLFNYLKKIKQDPNTDDLLTLGNMLAKLPQSSNLLADLWPAIQEILLSLPQIDQQQVINHFTKLKLSSPEDNKRAEKYWYLSNNKKFASLNDFEDYLSSLMDDNDPHALMKLIKQNQNLWNSLDNSFKQYVTHWIKQKAQEENNKPKFIDVFKNLLKNPEPSED